MYALNWLRRRMKIYRSLHLRAIRKHPAYTWLMSILADQLATARRAAGLSQQQLARKAGLSRSTVHVIESGAVDPQVGTLLSMARVLGLEPLLVPSWLKPEVVNFVRSGGKILGQPPGIGAPLSIVDELLRTRR
jgi:transcriptional regulator with XRE-family HTH domain